MLHDQLHPGSDRNRFTTPFASTDQVWLVDSTERVPSPKPGFATSSESKPWKIARNAIAIAPSPNATGAPGSSTINVTTRTIAPWVVGLTEPLPVPAGLGCELHLRRFPVERDQMAARDRSTALSDQQHIAA